MRNATSAFPCLVASMAPATPALSATAAKDGTASSAQNVNLRRFLCNWKFLIVTLELQPFAEAIVTLSAATARAPTSAGAAWDGPAKLARSARFCPDASTATAPNPLSAAATRDGLDSFARQVNATKISLYFLLIGLRNK